MVRCVACNSLIGRDVDGSTRRTDEEMRPSSTSVLSSLKRDIVVDHGVVYCSDDCAPRELRENPPEKNPLEALVEFFHQSNTEESLEYYTEIRGWSEETVNERMLGWAPADATVAYEHLREEGYSTAEILSTGAFSHDGSPPYECYWRGRYIIPYFDKSGEVVYAVSRSTGSKGGGAVGYDGHPADIMSGKYAKLSKKNAFSVYEEPIFGLQSLSEFDEDYIVITEGAPDAISAIEEEMPVLSPVTVQFSSQQYDSVVDLIEDEDPEWVYIVPDNEPVQESQEEREKDVSVGLEGGLKMAAELDVRELDNDISIVVPPRPEGVEKVDLDDFLQDHSKEKFEQLADTAPKPENIEEYEEYRETVKEKYEYRQEQQEKEYSGDGATGENRSAMFDLGILDVLPNEFSQRGDRGPNPIQHVGDSRNYFSVDEYQGSLIAHDFKRNVTYNPLTYILCEIGERAVDDPNGPMSNREIWLCWKWCKENGILGPDDPVPSSAITHIAESDLGYDASGDEDGYVPYDIYVNVINHIESKYDINPGRSTPN